MERFTLEWTHTRAAAGTGRLMSASGAIFG